MLSVLFIDQLRGNKMIQIRATKNNSNKVDPNIIRMLLTFASLQVVWWKIHLKKQRTNDVRWPSVQTHHVTRFCRAMGRSGLEGGPPTTRAWLQWAMSASRRARAQKLTGHSLSLLVGKGGGGVLTDPRLVYVWRGGWGSHTKALVEPKAKWFFFRPISEGEQIIEKEGKPGHWCKSLQRVATDSWADIWRKKPNFLWIPTGLVRWPY